MLADHLGRISELTCVEVSKCAQKSQCCRIYTLLDFWLTYSYIKSLFPYAYVNLAMWPQLY